MTPEFKTELQNLIDETAELELGDHYYVFKRGANFLMPLIETLLETINDYIAAYEYADNSRLQSLHNEYLLNLLKGEK